MKLEQWALVAEIFGGVAIVLSLVFVGLQIRNNTQVARAMAYERNLDSVNEWRLNIIDDSELTRSFGEFAGRFSDNAPTEEVEAFRLLLALNALFGVYEKSFYATEYGVMAREEWSRFEEQACVQRANAVDIGLWEDMERLLAAAFSDYLASTCQ